MLPPAGWEKMRCASSRVRPCASASKPDGWFQPWSLPGRAWTPRSSTETGGWRTRRGTQGANRRDHGVIRAGGKRVHDVRNVDDDFVVHGYGFSEVFGRHR